jgi:hypothetical protein
VHGGMPAKRRRKQLPILKKSNNLLVVLKKCDLLEKKMMKPNK